MENNVSYKTTNPVTGLVEREFASLTPQEIDAAIGRADTEFTSWRAIAVSERAAILLRVAQIYRARTEELARIIATEMGKPVRQGMGEVGLVADIYEYYATLGPALIGDEDLKPARGGSAVVRSTPLGVLLGVMPWNYPYYQVARFAAPNLLLGNTILLKHASNCPQAALVQEEIFREAGLPEDAYINLFAQSNDVESIIADPRVRGVSLTGSERAGMAVAEAAGRSLKKFVLELGGSDPFIVLEVDDLEATIDAAVSGRMSNAGQACTAAKRFIVIDKHYDDFVAGFTSRVSKMVPGDPQQMATRFGPLSSLAGVTELVAQVRDATDQGAVLHTGGHRVGDRGSFMAASVLTGVTPQMRAFGEELFGPVGVIYKVADAAEAIALANTSSFGLGSAVFASDVDAAHAVADALDVGMVFINENTDSHVDLPFGGTKRSGVGRELGRFALDEFVNKKLIRTP
ncbi:NAD-dependent succinate-semialdehyde dehydrogenase [Cryobacterium glaciale]|uniref:NAD-dependent succinate-semialdehyde dehydrogenase n=1 Tax=Cryobacterium glaciale TaxID=1259145 RepID=A0A4R8UTP7_9MICO|nr:NAD-dependent succinate-semialdehyde dehydrogenase [Cryobacterium glaciale]